MAFTNQQYATIKSDVQNNPVIHNGKTLAQWWAEGNPAQIAVYYAGAASPLFYVWRTSLSIGEMFDQFIDADWTAMDNLTVGQDRIWINLKELGGINPSRSAHRAALTECWKGTSAKVAVRDRIFNMGKREANRGEKLLSTGTGTLLDPATMSFEGNIEWGDINAAMES